MENAKPKVSIIVPLYNQEKYIDACLRSICGQTYDNIEIIIVNDGSTDKSPLKAEKWVESDKRVRLVNKKNEGTSFARRDGYLNATGEYITFVDNDDLLPAHAIEILVSILEDKKVDLVLGTIIRKLGVIRALQHYGSFPINEVVCQPELFDRYFIGFCGVNSFLVTMWGRLYRKSTIDEAYAKTELFSPDLPCMAGDEYFNMKLFPYLRSMYKTDQPVYIYRYGGTVDGYNRFFPEVFRLSDIRLKLLDDYGYSQGYGPLFNEYVDCFYYHAQQLMEFKQTDKAGVIDYFKKELDTRELLPRLMDWYKVEGIHDMGVDLMAKKDYEGMYAYAHDLMKKRCGSIMYQFKQLYKNILARM